MEKQKLTLIEGAAQSEPDRVEFACPQCKASCILWPKARPIAVQHALPGCRAWRLIEGKKDDLERFLIKAGVHLLVPQGKA